MEALLRRQDIGLLSLEQAARVISLTESTHDQSPLNYVLTPIFSLAKYINQPLTLQKQYKTRQKNRMKKGVLWISPFRYPLSIMLIIISKEIILRKLAKVYKWPIMEKKKGH